MQTLPKIIFQMYLLGGTAIGKWYILPEHIGFRRLLAKEAEADQEEQFYKMTLEGVPKRVLDKIKEEGMSN